MEFQKTPEIGLRPTQTQGAAVTGDFRDAFSLEIPPTGPKRYSLAQLDDYRGRGRGDFRWRPPLRLNLRARISDPDLQGTWGFGFWNAPMSLSIGFGSRRALPALPNCAWFFHSSEANHLSLRNDLPGNGFLAQTFVSPTVSPILLAPTLLGLPFLFWKSTAKIVKQLIGKFIKDDACQLTSNPGNWHGYTLEWFRDQVLFYADDTLILNTSNSPKAPLGFLIWVDNQYASLKPGHGLKWGTQKNNKPARLEITDFEIRRLSNPLVLG